MEEFMRRVSSLLVIVIIIIITLIAIIGGFFLYIKTDILKPKDKLFLKYTSKSMKTIEDTFDFSDIQYYLNQLEQNNFTNISELNVSYLENKNDKEEIYKVKNSGVVNNKEDVAYQNITIDYDNKELIKQELLINEEMFGLRVSNLVQEFVSFENKNLSYVISSMGYKGQYFSDSLNKTNISDLLNLSNEEKEILSEKYLKIIFSEFESKQYSAKKDVLITLINGESPTTKSYSLTINKNELDRIVKKIITEAIEDEIILKKLDEINEKIIKMCGSDKYIDLKNSYQQFLEKKLDSMEYKGIDERKIIFTVYRVGNETVRFSIKTETTEIFIDTIRSNGTEIFLKISTITEDGNDDCIYGISKMNKNGQDTRNFFYENENKRIECEINLKQEDDEILNIGIEGTYKSDSVYNIKIDSKQKFYLGELTNIPVKFKEKNNIILNNFEGEQINGILENLKVRIIKDIDKKQKVLNTKMLNRFLIWIYNREEEIEKSRKEGIEYQKARFNNKFILYQGENLSYNHIQQLLKAIKSNMSGYRIITGSKIEVIIQKGKTNIEKFNEIEKALIDKYTYNVKVKYSKDGVINAIEISVYTK